MSEPCRYKIIVKVEKEQSGRGTPIGKELIVPFFAPEEFLGVALQQALSSSIEKIGKLVMEGAGS
jgi:hypothetical protein